MAPYGHSLTSAINVDPLNSLSSTKDDYAFLMSRLLAPANAMFIYLPSIPEGWQVIHYKVLANMRQDNNTSGPVLFSTRTVCYSRSLANTGSFTRASGYVTSHNDTGNSNGTNAFITLDTPYVVSASSFGVIFMPFTSNNSMVLAATVETERVP
jgi:hypothetical protein